MLVKYLAEFSLNPFLNMPWFIFFEGPLRRSKAELLSFLLNVSLLSICLNSFSRVA